MSERLSLSTSALEKLIRVRSTEEWMTVVAEEIVRLFRPSRLVLLIKTKQGRYHPQPLEWCANGFVGSSAVLIRPIIRRVIEGGEEEIYLNVREDDELCDELEGLGHDSLYGITIPFENESTITALLFDVKANEDLKNVLHILSGIIGSQNTPRRSSASGSAVRYERLVEHSDAILFNADAEHRVDFISRRALDFFGMAPEEFVSEKRLKWTELVHPDDATRIRALLGRQRAVPQPFDEEVRVINRVTGRARWLLMRLVPVVDGSGKLTGWDGFGIDISARRDAQDALDLQGKKIRALYTVSSAIRGYLEPANIAIRGLAALCDATGAHAGICFLYPPQNPGSRGEEEWENVEPETKELESIARYGFPQNLADDDPLFISISAFGAHVAHSGQSLVVADLCSDPRSDLSLATQEELRSAVLVPIAVEDEVLGVVGLFSREISRFDGSTVMLVSAAANQIGLAARQANLFTLYRKQTKHLYALYRMSHELSRHIEMEPLIQNAFSIIRDELGLRRLWLGLLTDSKGRLVGQAAYGPGWRRRLVGVSVDVTTADHALGRVVTTKKPVVIKHSDELLREFGVKRVFSRMAIHSVALVPIISAGELMGVLAVQPGASEPIFQKDQLNLLLSLASEIGVNIQTQRLAARMQENEKMRTSSVLAAGIAHNFNNSLQAILGQATLLQMQSGSGDRVRRAAKSITEAATKSAELVRQLLAFTQFEEPRKEAVNVNEFIERSRDSFSKLLTDKNRLRLALSKGLEASNIDPSQLNRIFVALLQNSVEAMPNGGEVIISTEIVRFGEDKTVSEVPPGRYVQITVTDTGGGMNEEVKRRCFEPFFTTKNIEPGSGIGLSGSGLGLAAAYTLIRRNGGRILVESQVGSGTTFTVLFPIIGESESRPLLQVEKVRVGAAEIEQVVDEPEEKPAISAR